MSVYSVSGEKAGAAGIFFEELKADALSRIMKCGTVVGWECFDVASSTSVNRIIFMKPNLCVESRAECSTRTATVKMRLCFCVTLKNVFRRGLERLG